jgi:hypothetical protein
MLVAFPASTLAQNASPPPPQLLLQTPAAIALGNHWLNWRADGPENGGICLRGTIAADSSGVPVGRILQVSRVARLSGCSGDRYIGAAIFAPPELYEQGQLEELACAAVRGRDDWVVFGIIHGTRRRLLASGHSVVVAEGLWCVAATDEVHRLASFPRTDE